MPKTKLRDESVLWSIYSEAKTATEALDLQRRQGRRRVIDAMARAYNIDPRKIDQHNEPSLYPTVAKITRLIFPKHESAAANLKRELARGKLPFNDAYQIACGNARTREECRKGIPDTPATHSIDLSKVFAGIIAAATHAGYTADEIATDFKTALAAC